MTDGTAASGSEDQHGRRTWLPIAVAGALVAAVIGVVAIRSDPLTCAKRVDAKSPLLSVDGMAAQPDQRLDTLAAAVNGWADPFGPVRAGVGYDYDQWLHLYGLSDGLLALTKDNARMSLVDDASLEARWSLVPATKRTAWDASDDDFLLLDLTKDSPTRVGSFDLASGKESWCLEVPAAHADGEPVATTYLDGGSGKGDVLVALPKDAGLLVTRLRGKDGQVVWSKTLTGVGRGDYLGPLDQDTFVLGGVEEYRLATPDPKGRGGAVIRAFAQKDGAREWTWDADPGTAAHVVGVHDGHTLVVTATAGRSALLALDDEGGEVWRIRPAGDAVESTLRGDVVLMRTKTGLDAYDAATGKPRWHTDVPTDRTYFPYGFTLSQMPSLDATHVLMPTTTALRVLDVTTGKSAPYPLPTDGISTTYWPYQLAVTPKLLGVVTNTGGVVADRIPATAG
ncbi:outer membrane protein assembly factor BamB family protein [Marmoricola sp. RAF53]|uniref:outer membrane protein assembly factor BamB family protein n=1 Tax=Marmoricola sp. RAF53 TaxID=3233059 RepID=UPI003F9961AC